MTPLLATLVLTYGYPKFVQIAARRTERAATIS